MADDGLARMATQKVEYLHPDTARLLARVVGMMLAYEVERREVHRFVIQCSRLGPEEAEREAQLFFSRLFEAVHSGRLTAANSTPRRPCELPRVPLSQLQ